MQRLVMSIKYVHYLTSWLPGWFIFIVLFLFIKQATPTYIFEGSQVSFARFPKWDLKDYKLLKFEFLTNKSNGLLMYTDNGINDFIELKLSNGILSLRLNFGWGTTFLKTGNKLNDNNYHTVMIRIFEKNVFLELDNEISNIMHGPILGNNLELKNFSTYNDLFFGGLPLSYLSKLSLLSLPSVMFEERFEGRIHKILFLHEHENILFSPRDIETSGVMIVRENNFYPCLLNNSCLNGGKCVYKDNADECDCWDIGYQGVKCEAERLAVQFGPSTGMITIENLPKNMTEINLSFTFMTNSSNCILIYLENTESKKYLQVKLSDGKLIAVYWVVKFLKLLTVKGNFADLQYHRVNFTQKGQNIILTVDNLNAVSSKEEELTEIILSAYPMIEIGGTKNPETNDIDQPFKGIFLDFILDNIQLLNLIIDKDPRVFIEGNVTVQNFTALFKKPSSPSSGRFKQKMNAFIRKNDIFSGSGSGSGSGCGDFNDCDGETDSMDVKLPKISEPTLHQSIQIIPMNGTHNESGESKNYGCKDGDNCDIDDFFIQETFTIFQDNESMDNQTTDQKLPEETTNNPVSKKNKKNISSLNIYLILGLVAEGVILLIILSFAIYKFSQCRTQKRKKQQYSLVQNSNFPEKNDNKVVNSNYTIKENNYYD